MKKLNITRLSYCKTGSKIKIIDFAKGKGFLEKIKKLDLSISDEIEIKQNDYESAIIINKNSDEINIGREMASKVLVESDSSPVIPLTEIKIGDQVEIAQLKSQGEVRRRLMDMGMVKGVQFFVLRVAPLGDPIELSLNQFNLSLRLEEAKTIYVTPININLDKK